MPLPSALFSSSTKAEDSSEQLTYECGEDQDREDEEEEEEEDGSDKEDGSDNEMVTELLDYV